MAVMTGMALLVGLRLKLHLGKPMTAGKDRHSFFVQPAVPIASGTAGTARTRCHMTPPAKGVKHPRPQDARRDLRTLWSSVAVYSCGDGTLRIEPAWRKKFKRPGVITRMHSAYMVQAVLAMPLKKIDWNERYEKTVKPII